MSGAPRTAPEQCAQCGEAIPPRALACPECGADERTGWREQSIYDGLDLPDETPPSDPARKSSVLRWSTWAILVAFTAILLFSAFGRH